MTKPSRTYYADIGNKIVLGQRAVVSADPSYDYAYFTTEVLWYNSDTGEFETKNTRYVPLAMPDSSVVQ